MSLISTADLLKRKLSLCYILSCSVLISSCALRQNQYFKQLEHPVVSGIKFIDQYVIPNETEFKGTQVGGLSGIDYDPLSDTYFLISDDRSAINPARFYKAGIQLSDTGIVALKFKQVKYLLNEHGNYFPTAKENIRQATDPESIRFNPIQRQLIWSSEGERIIRADEQILVDPTLTISNSKGHFVGQLPLPENLRMQAVESGPRRNGVLEGISFGADYKELYASLEEPLYQDGPQAAFVPNNALVRIYRFDLSSRSCIAAYAYELDPVAHQPQSQKAVFNNGIPDLLWLGKQQFLMTERSYTADHKGTTIKLFLADFSNAEDISDVPSLSSYPNLKKVNKRLLLNLDELGIYIDNIEGATLGPMLPNGHRSLILIADNNFSKKQVSQVLLFELTP